MIEVTSNESNGYDDIKTEETTFTASVPTAKKETAATKM